MFRKFIDKLCRMCYNKVESVPEVKQEVKVQYGEEEQAMNDIFDVSDYILFHEIRRYEDSNRESPPITNLRMQKLLYFVQAQFLQSTDHPCFTNEMEAWQYGPVVPDAYERYKFFGSTHIGVALFDEDRAENLSEETKRVIDEALDLCSTCGSSKLVDISHAQPPWKNAYEQGPGTVITIESMRDYFVRGIGRSN